MITHKRKLFLISVVWIVVATGSATKSANAESIQIITDLGNVFSVKKEQNTDDKTNSQDPLSIIGGAGSNLLIKTVEPQGKVIHGKDTTGKESSLVPYVHVSPSSDFASVIQKDDREISMRVPEFAQEYRYDSSSKTLHPIKKIIPNILSYSSSKILSGTGKVTNDANKGISFEGPEKNVHKHKSRSHMHNVDVMAVKLNDLAGTKTLLRGTVNGDYIKIVESPTDLTKLPSYDLSNGYKILETSENTSVKKIKKGFVHIHGKCCKIRHWHDQSYWIISLETDVLASSPDSVRAYFDSSGRGSTGMKVTVEGRQQGDYYRITKLSFNTGSPWSINYGKNGVWRIFDALGPFNTILTFEKDFETQFTFPSTKKEVSGGKQRQQQQYSLYVLAQPDGRSKIKAEKFNPNQGIWFKVSGLPPNTPYQLEKNGMVGASGMSPSSGVNNNNAIVLTADEVDVRGQNTPGGTFKIYPDSQKYRGKFSTIVFDTINKQVFRIHDPPPHPPSIDRVYTPFAYIRIPFSTETSIEKIRVDETHLNYLVKRYAAGTAAEIPVLPGAKKIVLTASGIDHVLNIDDMGKRIGAKAIPPKSSSSTKYSANGAVSSIDSDAAGGAFAISTGSGQMYAMVTLSVSGDSAFSNDVRLYFVPDPPPPPVPRDPLSVYVDVYKNGRLVKSERIYYDDKPLFEPVSEINGLKLKQAITYHYSQRTVTSMAMVDVEPGDMVEFYARSNVHAEGIPVDVPSTSGGKYVVEDVISAASATSQIHSGSILTGMS